MTKVQPRAWFALIVLVLALVASVTIYQQADAGQEPTFWVIFSIGGAICGGLLLAVFARPPTGVMWLALLLALSSGGLAILVAIFGGNPYHG